MEKFNFPGYPISELEFESLMKAIDKSLAEEGKKPFQRPLHVGFKLFEAFEWSGKLIPPDKLADEPGYSGDILMAKALRWYKQTHARRLDVFGTIGYVPAKLGSTIWKVRIPVWFGRINFFCDRNVNNRDNYSGNSSAIPSTNILTLVEDLPQGMVDRISDSELIDFHGFFVMAMRSLEWMQNLPNVDLFKLAKDDYDCATQEILNHRYPTARWATQQSVEKLLKGLLSMEKIEYSTKGGAGHDLHKLSQTLYESLGISISKTLIELSSCSARVRYNEDPSTELQAWQANMASLGIYDILSNCKATNKIIEKHRNAESIM